MGPSVFRRWNPRTGAMTERASNHLAGETSPYLLQHAHNPVDWYPWGEEALARGPRTMTNPSSCRSDTRPATGVTSWSASPSRDAVHGAAHERSTSSRSRSTARSGPTSTRIYMDAVQAMTGHGGWPLSAFLTPDGRPFYAGTYFPPEPAHGMPSFRQVLEGIADAWRERRDELVVQASRVTEAIARAGELHGHRRALDRGDRPRGRGIARSCLRRPMGWVRCGAQVPAAHDARVPPSAGGARRA